MVLRLMPWLGLVVGCTPETSAPPGSDPSSPPPPPPAEEESEPPPPMPVQREITVLYTNDEHGWMEGQDPVQSAAHLVTQWRDQEGYDPDGPFVVLSGGDMWTGPAISTWFEGESMVEVMNLMGYDAAAVGNHEFDFGLDELAKRASEMTFPLVSANIREAGTDQVPQDLGFTPTTLLEVNGVRIGIVGLTTRSTPQTTLPQNVASLDFIDYEEALRAHVPELRAQGADLIFAPGHVCMYELEPLADRIGDLGVDLLGGGHCNELVATERNGIVMLEGGSQLRSYAWARFTYDVEQDTVVNVTWGQAENEGMVADPTVQEAIDRWSAAADAELDRVIGYAAEDWWGDDLWELIAEPIVLQNPSVDFYLTNRGSARAALPAGDITVGDIVTVLPFANTLVELELTGAQLDTVVANHDPAIGGGYEASDELYLNDGRRVDPTTVYRVQVSSFVYQGGDGFTEFASFDPDGTDTGIHFRDPVLDWIEAQATSAERPLAL